MLVYVGLCWFMLVYVHVPGQKKPWEFLKKNGARHRSGPAGFGRYGGGSSLVTVCPGQS